MNLRRLVLNSKEQEALRKVKELKEKGLTNSADIARRLNKMSLKDKKNFDEAPRSELYFALCREIEIEKGLIAPEIVKEAQKKKKKKKKTKSHNPQTTAVEQNAPEPFSQIAISPLIAIDKIYAMVYEDAKEAPTPVEILKLKTASREELWDFFQNALTKGKAGLFINKFKECGAFDALFPEGAPVEDPRDIFYKKFIEGYVSVDAGYQQFGQFAVKKVSQESDAASICQSYRYVCGSLK